MSKNEKIRAKMQIRLDKYLTCIREGLIKTGHTAEVAEQWCTYEAMSWKTGCDELAIYLGMENIFEVDERAPD